MKPACALTKTIDIDTMERVTEYSFGTHGECDCGVHIICEGYPYHSTPTTIGHYVSGSVGGDAIDGFMSSGTYCIAYIDPAYVGFTGDTQLEGFYFV